jgi:quinoprotein relay system zinc metallohydrolase 2
MVRRAAWIVGFFVTTSALAVEPLDVREVAPGVYVHEGAQEEPSAVNEGAIANVGFIVGESTVMVIDTGGSVRSGERLRSAVRAVTDRPIRYVVFTHVHPDHILGAAAFKADEPEFIGHAKLPGALAQRGPYYIRTSRRALGEKAEGNEIVPPGRVIEDREEIDLGNRVVTIRAHRTAHTDNDLSIFDRKTATLWLGDLLFIDRVPVIDGSLVGWLRELAALERIPAARAVPGHGPAIVDWPLATEPQKRYLEAVLVDTRAAIKAGVSIGDAAGRVATAERDRWLLFDDFHARNVTAAFKELEWE